MSDQATIVAISNQQPAPFATALAESNIFPVVDATWSTAMDAVARVQPAAVIAAAGADDQAADGGAVPSRVMRFTTSDLASATGGEVFGRETTVDGVGIDSRSIRPGQLFVPIVAERDGHDFIGAAGRAGAAAHLTTGPIEAGNECYE